MSDYAPFPEQELAALAAYHEDVAAKLTGPYAKGVQEARAQVCRDAIASHVALRERCLLAELERDHGVAQAAD